jgi:serine protease AprX
MKKYLLYILLFTFGISAAQEDAWVYFTDKPQASFYLSNPLQMLSQRALERRAAQGIALDNKDVPLHQPYINEVSAAPGITVMAHSKWLNSLHIRGNVASITALTALPFVEHVDFANKLLTTQSRSAQAQQTIAVNKSLETAANFAYGNSNTQIQMLNGHLLHQQEYTGAGKIIAVLDSGFPGVNTTQPFQRLITNNRILGGYNFVAQSDNFYTGHFHGTYVLSTMGGYTESQLVGTAPDASYYLFVTEDAGSENPVEESYWVEAAEKADSLGVDVINTSLGYFTYDNPNYSYTYNDMDGETAFITRGSNIAFSRGMICVTSAGNSGSTANPHITVPGDAFNTLTIGAVNTEEVISGFSSVGPSFDGRVKPDVVAQGVNSVVAIPNGTITTANGTSFSGPITAGLVACLWQALPQKTNLEIIQLVRQSADRFANPNAQYGYGVPDFGVALQNGLDTEELIKQDFALYPNPANDVINIALPDKSETALISIFNSLGQLVMKQSVSRALSSFPVNRLSSGIYIYRIEAGQHTKGGRLIKE